MELMYTHQKQFDSEAYTLSDDCIGLNKSGWRVLGKIHEDYYTWVNDFEAQHPVYGVVKGNFETQVWASSKSAYDHFMKHHAPTVWDYWDI